MTTQLNDDMEVYLSSFKYNSYNRSQIGNNKTIITQIYKYLSKINFHKEDIEESINSIAYLNKKDINLPLYLELLSKSIGFITNYNIEEILKVIKEVHDVYFKRIKYLSLEEYIFDTEKNRTKQVFQNYNKYIGKNFNSNEAQYYLNNLKFACAVYLSDTEYKELINFIEDDNSTHSPLIIITNYNKIRNNLENLSKLFWDLIFACEYVNSLYKHNISLKDVFKNNLFSKEKRKEEQVSIQLDLFSYQDFKEEKDYQDIKVFQYCTLYNLDSLPSYRNEKTILLFYNSLITGKDMIILPKLKKVSKITKDLFTKKIND